MRVIQDLKVSSKDPGSSADPDSSVLLEGWKCWGYLTFIERGIVVLIG